MSMNESQKNHRNTFLRICVDDVEGRRISGRIYSHSLSQPLFFTDMSNLLLQAENILDVQGFPKAFQRKRTFGNADGTCPVPENSFPPMPIEEIEQARGKNTTFTLYIHSWLNTTWQGRIEWMSGESMDFNSALECIFLVDQVIFG